jgi:hypothetical protein
MSQYVVFIARDIMLSHRDHNTRVLVPAEQRIVPIFRARFLNVCSSSHEVFV